AFFQLAERPRGGQLLPARLGGQQQAAAGTDRAAGQGGQLDAKSAIGAAHVVLAALEVAQGQRALVLGGGGLGTAFTWRVVQTQQLVAAAAVLAAGQGLALEPGEYCAVIIAIEPGRGVAGCARRSAS